MIRSIGVTVGGRVLAAFGQAALLVLLARAVTPSEFGLVGAFVSLCLIVQFAGSFGLPAMLTVERAQGANDSRVEAIIGLSVVCALGSGALVAGVALVGAYLGLEQLLWLTPLSLVVAMERMADIRLALAFSDGKAGVEASFMVARRLLAVALFPLLERLMPALLAFSIAWVSAAAVVSVGVWFRIRTKVYLPDRTSAMGLLRDARPFWIYALSAQIRNADVLVLAAVSTAGQVGFYAAVNRLVSPMVLVPQAAARILMRQVAQSSDARSTERMVLWWSLAAFSCTAILSGVAFWLTPTGVEWLLGEDFTGASSAMRVAIAGYPFVFVANLFAGTLQGMGLAAQNSRVAAAVSVLTLLLIVALGFEWGALGAAAAVAMGSALSAIWLSVLMARYGIGGRSSRR